MRKDFESRDHKVVARSIKRRGKSNRCSEKEHVTSVTRDKNADGARHARHGKLSELPKQLPPNQSGMEIENKDTCFSGVLIRLVSEISEEDALP